MKTLLVAGAILAIIASVRLAWTVFRYEQGFGDAVVLRPIWVLGIVPVAIATAAILVSKKVV